MSRKRDRGESDDDVEAIERELPPGPLGPWRLSLAIVATAAFTGMPLMDAATTGEGLDLALLRSFGVAFLTWIAVGRINRVLADASAPKADGPGAEPADQPDWSPDQHHLPSH